MYTTAVIQLCNSNNSYRDDIEFLINSRLCYRLLLVTCNSKLLNKYFFIDIEVVTAIVFDL